MPNFTRMNFNMQKFPNMENSNSRTFKDLLCFQGLSRAWNFSSKIQGLLKDPMNPDGGFVLSLLLSEKDVSVVIG